MTLATTEEKVHLGIKHVRDEACEEKRKKKKGEGRTRDDRHGTHWAGIKRQRGVAGKVYDDC